MAAALHLTPTQMGNQKLFAEPHVYDQRTGKPYEYTNYIETGTARGGQETINRVQLVGVSTVSVTEQEDGNSQTYDKVAVVLRFQGPNNESFLALLFYDPKGTIELGVPFGQGTGNLIGVSNYNASYAGVAFGLPPEALVGAVKGQSYDLKKKLEFTSHEASRFNGHYSIYVGDYMAAIFDVAGGPKTPMQTFIHDYLNGANQGNFVAARKAMQDKVGESAPVLIGAADTATYMRQEFLRGVKNIDFWTAFARLYDLSSDAQDTGSDVSAISHIFDTMFPSESNLGRIDLNGRNVDISRPSYD